MCTFSIYFLLTNISADATNSLLLDELPYLVGDGEEPLSGDAAVVQPLLPLEDDVQAPPLTTQQYLNM